MPTVRDRRYLLRIGSSQFLSGELMAGNHIWMGSAGLRISTINPPLLLLHTRSSPL